MKVRVMVSEMPEVVNDTSSYSVSDLMRKVSSDFKWLRGVIVGDNRAIGHTPLHDVNFLQFCGYV